MTLTVRLPEPLDHALEDYCAEHGLTKSRVVQESLAEYLVRAKKGKAEPVREREVSENYRALKKAGLIGCFRGDGISATKEVVRRKVLESLKSRG